MVRIRFVDGVQEVDGNPQELAEFLRYYNTQIHTATIEKLPEQPKETSNDEPHPLDIPTADQIVKIIEDGGRPFTFSMAEQQIKLYGKIISSKLDRSNYGRFYGETRKALKMIAKKYGGKWDPSTEMVGKTQSKRYTLIEEIKEAQSMPQQEEHIANESRIQEATVEKKGLFDY